MCELYTKSTTLAWLESQVAVLDCWVEDISTNPTSDIGLLDCVDTHRNWLKSEIALLSQSASQSETVHKHSYK